ncbi:MAG: hypothetical protein WBG43_10710 [Marinifilaceae bacterium]
MYPDEFVIVKTFIAEQNVLNKKERDLWAVFNEKSKDIQSKTMNSFQDKLSDVKNKRISSYRTFIDKHIGKISGAFILYSIMNNALSEDLYIDKKGLFVMVDKFKNLPEGDVKRHMSLVKI